MADEEDLPERSGNDESCGADDSSAGEELDTFIEGGKAAEESPADGLGIGMAEVTDDSGITLPAWGSNGRFRDNSHDSTTREAGSSSGDADRMLPQIMAILEEMRAKVNDSADGRTVQEMEQRITRLENMAANNLTF